MCVNKGQRRNFPVTQIPLCCSPDFPFERVRQRLANVWLRWQSKLDLSQILGQMKKKPAKSQRR